MSSPELSLADTPPFTTQRVIMPDLRSSIDQAHATLRVVRNLDHMYGSEVGHEAASRAVATDPFDVLAATPRNEFLLAVGHALSAHARELSTPRLAPQRAFVLGAYTASGTVHSSAEVRLNDDTGKVFDGIMGEAQRLVESHAADYRAGDRLDVLAQAHAFADSQSRAFDLSDEIMRQLEQDTDVFSHSEAARHFAGYLETRVTTDSAGLARDTARSVVQVSDIDSFAAGLREGSGPSFTRTIIAHMVRAEVDSDLLDDVSPLESYRYGVAGSLAFVALAASRLVDGAQST